jgi:dynein heavy chain 1, cytosolic
LDESKQSEILESFLSGSPTKLFVWRNPEDETILNASVESVPKAVTSTVLVICKSLKAGEATVVADAADLQCLTVRSVLDLRRYISECFRPFVDDEAATAKLRELELALTASQRSTRLPHVVLHTPAAPAATADEDETLNELQNTVKEWIVQIRKVTDLVEDTPFDQENEVSFWNSLGQEIAHIQDQLKSPTIQSTLNILREAKRFVAVLALENNTNLEQAATTTAEVNNFLKALPLPKLLAARDFSTMVETGGAVFENLTKIRATRCYSLERSVQLVSYITGVIRDTVKETLELTPNWMLLDYKEYETKIYFPVTDVFAQLEDWLSTWKDFTLELARRRKAAPGLNRLIENMPLLHKPLQERLEKVHEFRANHEQLRSVVHAVLRQEEPEALQQVEQSPRQFWSKVSDVYEDSKSFQMALDEYDLEMDAMEERLARLLRDKLQACKVRDVLFRQ